MKRQILGGLLYMVLLSGVSSGMLAQNEVLMKYRFWASNSPEGGMSRKYHPGSSEILTPLAGGEMKSITRAFFDYVSAKDSVVNYVESWGGEVAPTQVPSQSILHSGSSKLTKEPLNLGGYIMNTESLEKIWINQGVPMQGTKVLCERGQTRASMVGEPAIAGLGLSREEVEGICHGLSFLETWKYNSESGFQKSVHFMGVMREHRIGGELAGLKHFLQFRMNPEAGVTEAHLFKKDVWTEVLFDACNQEYLGDICYSYMFEGFNEGFLSVPDRYRLLNGLFQDIREGKLKGRKYFVLGEPAANIIITPLDFENALKVELIHTRQHLETGEIEQVTTVEDLEYSDLAGIRFLEDWYFDPGRFIMSKRVRGLVLLKHTFNEIGEVHGVEALGPFIIDFD